MRAAAAVVVLVSVFAAGVAVRPRMSAAYRSLVAAPAERGPRAPAPHDRARHEALVRGLSPDTDTVFLGDSLTDFWRDVPDLWERYCGPRAANLGVGWECTEHVLWRIENGAIDPARIRPKVFVVLIGTNNLGRGDSPEATALGVRAVVSAVRLRHPQARILLLGLLPRERSASDPLRQKVADTNRLLAEVPDVRFLDIGHLFLLPDGTPDPAAMPDALHLTPEGYRRWGEAMGPPLDELRR